MPFRAHNAYYLRISSNDVIPLYLYLDDKHIEWMSDRTLQHVLEDLRPLVLPKLKAEVHGADAKQRTVEVHRGETYQFAFFFRNTEPHSVLIKTRTFVAAPSKKAGTILPPQDISAGNSPVKKKTRKRTKETAGIPRSSREQQKGKGKARRNDPEGEEDITSSSDDSGDNVQEVIQTPIVPRRSGRSRKLVAGGYQGLDGIGEDSDSFGNADIEMSPPHGTSPTSNNLPTPELAPDETDPLALIPDREVNTAIVKDEDEEPTLGCREGIAPQQEGLPEVESEIHMHDPPRAEPPSASDVIEIEIEEEEEVKPKPLLRLRYQGFTIHGHCLCIIVEPYPPVRSSSRAPSLAPLSGTSISRTPSIAPPTFVTSEEAGRRARTPLFLPEMEYDRGDTPAFARQRTLPPVPLFNEFEEDNVIDEDSESGLMAFSQIMSAGVHRFGAIDDDDEIDGAVFFGDADESREL